TEEDFSYKKILILIDIMIMKLNIDNSNPLLNKSEFIQYLISKLNELKIYWEYWFENTPKVSEKLTIKQIALIYIYKNKRITENNANEIVKEYGHKSGRKLYQMYLRYALEE